LLLLITVAGLTARAWEQKHSLFNLNQLIMYTEHNGVVTPIDWTINPNA